MGLQHCHKLEEATQRQAMVDQSCGQTEVVARAPGRTTRRFQSWHAPMTSVLERLDGPGIIALRRHAGGAGAHGRLDVAEKFSEWTSSQALSNFAKGLELTNAVLALPTQLDPHRSARYR